MIQVDGLSKQFDNQMYAVRNVSFAVSPGELFGLLGENGAGKTTTLRMLATILQPTAGEATLNGNSLRQHPERVRRELGFLTADAGLYGRMTAEENVAYFGRFHGMESRLLKARTEELFSLLGLTGVARKPVGNFSKGMKQKVCLARTFIHDPKILLLDEPTTGLDLPTARAVNDFILGQKRAGKLIIFSSHIMSEVENLCDRVAIIHRGEITATGTLDELRQTSQHARFEDVFLRLVGGAS